MATASARSRVLRVLAHDPGSKSYGIAAVEITVGKPISKKEFKNPKTKPLSGLKFKVLYVGLLNSRYYGLKKTHEIGRETIAYMNEISKLVDDYQIDLQIGERYMTRGIKGVTIEFVNMMLGTLRGIAVAKKTPLKVMPAAQWKVPLGNRGVDLDEIYSDAKTYQKTTPHEVDAIFIGLYAAFAFMQRRPYFVRNPGKLAREVVLNIKRLKGGKK